MSDNKITQDQLESNVMEELESGIGDLSTLSTENKDSLVAAVTEIYGKNVIAEAIGEPLAVTDTFSEMGSEINGLLSTFKTNMMNAGVVVESGDKFKALIDKIKGLTEGEGNKGVQFTSGLVTTTVKKEHTYTLTEGGEEKTFNSYDIELTFDFEPSIIYVYNKYTITSVGIPANYESVAIFDALEMQELFIADNGGTGADIKKLPHLIEDGKYYIPITDSSASALMPVTSNESYWYAIGVGEEDTTLRDSLASILTDEGVSVTEEDDMASLITKVDEEFDRLNPSKHIVQIETSASGNNTFIVKNDGSLWACGYNHNGELGLGNEDIVRTLTQVTTNINNDVKEVSCGAITTMLLKTDGTLWVCGKDSYGSLAIPDVNETSTFIQVPDMYDVKHIISGYYFTLAIKNDGSLWACGSNGNGQLGLGDTDGRSTFTQVTTNINNDVKEFYCSNVNNENTVFIVKSDGSVWGSGYNLYGRLGTGDTTNKNVFTQII